MCGNISHKRAPLNENLAKEFPQSLIPDEFGKLHCVCVYTHTHTHSYVGGHVCVVGTRREISAAVMPSRRLERSQEVRAASRVTELMNFPKHSR